MYNADAARERREYFRTNKRCTRCGKRDNRTMSGKAYCVKCDEIVREYVRYSRSKKKITEKGEENETD